MRDFLKIYWPLILIAALGLLVALLYVEPAPPKRVTFAAGSPGGAYHAYAQRYQALLEENGVAVELIDTNGSLDNLRLLEHGDADIALVQGGVARPQDETVMVSLGGMFFEPFWVFVAVDHEAETFADLRNARMAIGGEGSGTRHLALALRTEFGGSWAASTNEPLSGAAAASALVAGELDAAVFTASIDAPYVRALLSDASVRVMPFDRASALSRRAPALAPVTLLRGVVDIGGDVPARDIRLIAPVAQLTARKDLHPAIQALLVEAASAIHAEGSLLASVGRFPDPRFSDLPIAKEAQRYYDRGSSALRRVFSFGTANFLERAWILLIPLLTLLIPLVRLAPPVYRWRVRRKIYVWYSDLRDLEMRGRTARTPADRDVARQHLTRLQEEVGRLEVPLSYTDDLYRLRSHIAFVNQLLGNLDPSYTADVPGS